MRHRVYGKKLNRNSNQRAGLFKSLVQSLFLSGTITTSQTKALAIKGMVDKIINQAKNKDTQRLLKTYFTDKALQNRLIEEIAPKLQSRISGYTSLIKVGVQQGDRTTMVKMSLIGNEELKPLSSSHPERSEGSNKEIAASPATKVVTPPTRTVTKRKAAVKK